MVIPACNGDQDEMKRLIAREYNASATAQQGGDEISSGNLAIDKVVPQGANAAVTFRINDGVFPPDVQERGLLGWVLAGGIAAGIAHHIYRVRRMRQPQFVQGPRQQAVFYGAP
jgi:hypothetical protein